MLHIEKDFIQCGTFIHIPIKVVWPLNYAYYLTDQTMHIIWQQFLSTYVINFLKENKQVFGPFYGNSKTSNLMDRRVDFL